MAVEIKGSVKKKTGAVSSGLGSSVNTGMMPLASSAVKQTVQQVTGTGSEKTVTKDAMAEKAVAALKQQQSSAVKTPDYSIDYNDERFKNVEAQKKEAIDKSNTTYDQMIGQSDSYYQGLMDEADRYAEEQAKLQNEKTDFAIEEIEQQKAQEQEDYTDEQQAAYVDWQRQSDQYGAGAEQMAASGLMGTGYSESSQVAMWTAYQNRVAVARQTFNRAMTEYNNAITEARLSNNSILAEIAHDAWLKKAEYALEGFQYKNDLLQDKLDREQELDNEYYSRWQDVLAQQNQENAMAEEVRQFNESKQLEMQQMEIEQKQWQTEYDLKKQEYEESIRQFDEEMARLKAKDTEEAKQAAAQLKLQRDQLKQEQKQWKAEMKEEKRQFDATLKEEKRQFNVTSKKANSSSGGSSGGTTGKTINKTNGGSGTDEPKNNNQTGEKAATSAQKKKYNTFQTNIANMMMNRPNEKTIDNMAKQIEEAYEAGKITEAQARELLGQLD